LARNRKSWWSEDALSCCENISPAREKIGNATLAKKIEATVKAQQIEIGPSEVKCNFRIIAPIYTYINILNSPQAMADKPFN
jgi:hypothetical protein